MGLFNGYVTIVITILLVSSGFYLSRKSMRYFSHEKLAGISVIVLVMYFLSLFVMLFHGMHFVYYILNFLSLGFVAWIFLCVLYSRRYIDGR